MAILCNIVPLLTVQVAAARPTAQEILDKVDDLYRGRSSRGEMTMTVVTQHWTREVTMNFWSQGEEKTLIRVRVPLKEKGTATLKSGNNIWNYLPKVKRTIKIPTSMMGSSWMGSHFSHNDLVKQHRMAESYLAKVTFAGAREGKAIVEITAIAKQDAPVVWGKLVATVREASLTPISILYFKEDMTLGRTITFGDIKPLGKRRIPMLMRVTPADRPQESTVIHYRTLAFDIPLPDGLFSLRSLQR